MVGGDWVYENSSLSISSSKPNLPLTVGGIPGNSDAIGTYSTLLLVLRISLLYVFPEP